MPVKNELGNKYSKLTVIKRDLTRESKFAYWICECECGNTCSVSGANLRTGNTTSCGCARLIKTERNYKRDLVGSTFGRLVVIKKTDERQNGHVVYLCKCECSEDSYIKVKSDNLTSGNTKSCGCLQKERSSEALTKTLTGKIGKDSYHYNPDISDEERELKRNTPENKQFREEVYKRDNYTCQCCSDNTGGNLNAHHKNSWKDYPEQRYNIDNGITLCNKCHILFHKLYGYGNNNIEQLKDFLINFKSDN